MTVEQMRARIMSREYRPTTFYFDRNSVEEEWDRFKRHALRVIGLNGNPQADLLFEIANELGFDGD